MKQKWVARTLSCLVLTGIILLSLASCGDGYYSPIKSSRLERTAVAKMGEYEINYELVRFIFMSRIDRYDGGDRSRWQGEEAAALWETAKADFLAYISDIYAVFDICRAWGIDPEGDNIDSIVDEYVKADIDGGEIAGQTVEGYGSVEAYKQALADSYCTDAVRRLLYRYSACLSSLYSYVAVNGAEGKAAATEEDLKVFLSGDDYAHINRVFIPFGALGGDTPEEQRAAVLNSMLGIREKMIAANGDYAELIKVAFRRSYSSVSSLASDSQINNGIWIGKYSADRDYSETLYDTIFSIQEGEISDIIETDDGCYILYGMSKGTAPLDQPELRQIIVELWREELYSKQIQEKADELSAGIVYKKRFSELSGAALMEGK